MRGKKTVLALTGVFLAASGALLAPAAGAAATETAADRYTRVMYNQHGGKYNVITFQWSPNHTVRLRRPQQCTRNGSFMTIAFVHGTFRRSGDGGYKNWAFRGSFTRGSGSEEKFVTFRTRKNSSTEIQNCPDAWRG
ncbi:hypothetical protein [Crossiella cryophila]|uniref:Opacity protein-like surface antigen n=1 Tax=Crossiella cryophila TaxID=43355 RepID=A0A7W7CCG7_9PSEU|nr:hypothetical protein [Crossiella cryophila]MBB4678568.1 opacity protein-like surface antigen [Crossiella cryophila]